MNSSFFSRWIFNGFTVFVLNIGSLYFVFDHLLQRMYTMDVPQGGVFWVLALLITIPNIFEKASKIADNHLKYYVSVKRGTAPESKHHKKWLLYEGIGAEKIYGVEIDRTLYIVFLLLVINVFAHIKLNDVNNVKYLIFAVSTVIIYQGLKDIFWIVTPELGVISSLKTTFKSIFKGIGFSLITLPLRVDFYLSQGTLYFLNKYHPMLFAWFEQSIG